MAVYRLLSLRRSGARYQVPRKRAYIIQCIFDDRMAAIAGFKASAKARRTSGPVTRGCPHRLANRNSASGRHTSPRAALPTTMPTCPVRGRCMRARGSPARAAGRAAGARSNRLGRRKRAPAPECCADRPCRRGSPRSRGGGVADLPVDQEVLRRLHRHRHSVRQPVLERDEEPRRRPVGVEVRELLELHRRLDGLTRAKSI